MFSLSKKIFAVFFLVITLGGVLCNMTKMHIYFTPVLLSIGIPKTPTEARQAIKVLTYSIDTTIFEKPCFIELYAYIQKLMNKHEMSDFDYLLSDTGALKVGNFYSMESNKLHDYALRVYRLKQAVEKRGGKMLFMGATDAVNDGDSFAAGLPVHKHSPEQDSFFYYLQELGVNYLDTRDTLRESGLHPDMIMFKTDHHWTVEASFEAFKGLVDKMEKLFNVSLDPDGYYRDINNYDAETREGIFLGSFGRSTGIVFSGLDNFTVLLPKFDNLYSVGYINPVYRSYVERYGSFKETLYPPAALDVTYPYNNPTPYYFLYGLNSWAKIVNRSNPDGPKLLLIHDSFMQPVAVFLAPMFSEIHMIWPVYSASENPSPLNVEKYLSENKFDYVIVELYPSNINDHGVNFFK